MPFDVRIFSTVFGLIFIILVAFLVFHDFRARRREAQYITFPGQKGLDVIDSIPPPKPNVWSHDHTKPISKEEFDRALNDVGNIDMNQYTYSVDTGYGTAYVTVEGIPTPCTKHRLKYTGRKYSYIKTSSDDALLYFECQNHGCEHKLEIYRSAIWPRPVLSNPDANWELNMMRWLSKENRKVLEREILRSEQSMRLHSSYSVRYDD